MVGSTDVSNFVKNKIEVGEPDKTETFEIGKTTTMPQADGTQVLHFVGLDGSGKRELAQQAAEAFGMTYVDGFASPSPFELLAAGDVQGKCIAWPQEVITLEPARQGLKASGKVYYLMGSVGLIVHRAGGPDKVDEPERERLAKLLGDLEPLFMQTLHYILRPERGAEELLEDIEESMVL